LFYLVTKLLLDAGYWMLDKPGRWEGEKVGRWELMNGALRLREKAENGG
jgi:hypothetical protein